MTAPGEVTIALAVEDGAAVPAVLRVTSAGAGDALGGSWAPVLRKAARTAFAACRALSKSGPRFAFDQHRFVIEGDVNPARVIGADGLALPTALAMASLWLDRPVEVAAAGSLFFGGGTWRVGGVADAEGTASALEGRTTIGGSTLPEALTKAGLQLDETNFEPTEGGEAELRAGVTIVRAKQSPPDRGDPWADAAERLAVLVERDVSEEAANAGRVAAAVAFVRAGETNLASGMLRGLDDGASRPPCIHLLGAVSELGRAVDQERFDGVDALQSKIEGHLDSDDEDVQALRAQAKVAVGRAHLHQRNLEPAIAVLTEAVELSAKHLPHELGRARQYLAMAQRESGDAATALATLDQALIDLTERTRTRDLSAYESFKMYVDYERARALIALDRPAEAVRAAETAMAAAGHRGPWPAMAILRALAWAHRIGGDIEPADAVAALIADMKVFPGLDGLRDALAEEARGGPISGGQVH